MGMGADHGCDTVFEILEVDAFFTCCLSMEINQDDIRRDMIHDLLGDKDWILIISVHEYIAKDIQHCNSFFLDDTDQNRPLGCIAANIGRPDDIRTVFSILQKSAFGKSMVAQCNHIDAGCFQTCIKFPGHAFAIGRIFTIGNDEIRVILRPQQRCESTHS